jgi:sec-independent protein translocase protein TatC
MAKKVGVDDLFDDGSMSFGEHIEELRTHLMRAVWGILAAGVFTIIFADRVVEVLTWPLKGKLETWHKNRLDTLTNEYVFIQQALPEGERAKVEIPLTFSPEDQQKLAPGRKSTEPMTLTFTVEAYHLVKGLAKPLAEVTQPWSIKTLSAQEPFMMYFKAAIGAAIILASPWVFFQVYSFIAVGLYAHERRFVRMTLPICVGLFIGGVLFCYFAMLPLMLRFLIGVNDWMGLQPDIRLNEWIGFCVLLMLVFGIAFQLPVLIVVLERVGLVTYEFLAGKRRHAIFLIFVFAAIATPTPDPISQAVLAVPLYLLFEAGLFMMARSRRSTVTGEDVAPAAAFDDLLAGQFK